MKMNKRTIITIAKIFLSLGIPLLLNASDKDMRSSAFSYYCPGICFSAQHDGTLIYQKDRKWNIQLAFGEIQEAFVYEPNVDLSLITHPFIISSPSIKVEENHHRKHTHTGEIKNETITNCFPGREGANITAIQGPNDLQPKKLIIPSDHYQILSEHELKQTEHQNLLSKQ